MSRTAVFVDAGYLLAASARTITGHAIKRQYIKLVNPEKMLKALSETSVKIADNGNLLRVYWYDALHAARLSMEQETIAYQPGAKLRLGSLNNAGEQKGVDSLIVTDIIELARNKAISDAVLVSGDEDLRIAVQVAQSYGVKVHILSVGDRRRTVSSALQMEADSVCEVDKDWLAPHFKITEEKPVADKSAKPELMKPAKQTPASELKLEEVAEQVINEILGGAQAQEINALVKHFEGSTNVPPEYDGRLIAKTGAAMGRVLKGGECRTTRGLFIRLIRARAA